MSLLAAALAKAQAEFKPIERTKVVTVKTDKGAYTFAYAPLDVVLAATLPALNANGLTLTSLVLGGKPHRVRTLMLHTSGQFLAIELELPAEASARPQSLGSALTYYRRYSITCLLCVAAEEDDDGNEAQGNQVTAMQTRPPKARTEAQSAALITEGPRARATEGDLDDLADAVKAQAWTKAGTLAWLRKHFAVEAPEALTRQQVGDALGLIFAQRKSAAALAEKLAELMAAGRVASGEK